MKMAMLSKTDHISFKQINLELESNEMKLTLLPPPKDVLIAEHKLLRDLLYVLRASSLEYSHFWKINECHELIPPLRGVYLSQMTVWLPHRTSNPGNYIQPQGQITLM